MTAAASAGVLTMGQFRGDTAAGTGVFVVVAVCGVETAALGFNSDWIFEGVVVETNGCWG